jgi:DNA repair photolyase
MPLNKSTGNMYEFITHTWNTIKGECPHNCSYCYMHRWGKQKSVRFDEKELKTDLGTDNFIFVGSSCDMFAEKIPYQWIHETMEYLQGYFGNSYLFQSKNPSRIKDYYLPNNSVICTTIETNRIYKSIMNSCPLPEERSEGMVSISDVGLNTFCTIEPIMDFDLKELAYLIGSFSPQQVNIGADTGRNNLPEPPKEKILELISELEKFTIVHQKSNLKRLLT